MAFLGFILVTCLFIACFFYLNYQAVIFLGFPWFGHSDSASTLQTEATTLNANQRLGVLDEGGDTCDIYDANQRTDFPFASELCKQLVQEGDLISWH